MKKIRVTMAIKNRDGVTDTRVELPISEENYIALMRVKELNESALYCESVRLLLSEYARVMGYWLLEVKKIEEVE